MNEDGFIYRTRKNVIHKDDALFAYFDDLSALSNNLHNAVRFRQRQVLTAVKKPESEWTPNESSVMREIRDALPLMGDKYRFPTDKNHFLSYQFLDALLKVTKNPDYLAPGLPRQTAQQVIKQCIRDMNSFFAAVKEHKKNSSAFTGKPELPGYARKGGRCTTVITNQDAVLLPAGSDTCLKLPLTKTRLKIGEPVGGSRLKEVKVCPSNGCFVIHSVFEYLHNDMPVSEVPERIASIDPGVSNLMAVTNNCGLPSLIYRGGYIKSINRLYNKKIADIMSAQTSGGTEKFHPDDRYHAVTMKRNNCISDAMHKTAEHFIRWCVENRIDTIVFGDNSMWKQEASIGNVNTQNFVQIPHAVLKSCIRYRAESHGIRFISQEESYTSRASFLDMDDIPVYSEETEPPVFSGHRAPKHYKGMYKASGFRGIYVSSDGTFINSDLNGSANIMRKAFPEAFASCCPSFDKVEIIVFPDKQADDKNHVKQTASPKVISRSKQKRLARRALKVSPLG